MLEYFGIQHCKLMSTPLAAYFRLSAALSSQLDEKEEYILLVLYVSAAGIIIYAMIYTRLDISQVINVVSRYMRLL